MKTIQAEYRKQNYVVSNAVSCDRTVGEIPAGIFIYFTLGSGYLVYCYVRDGTLNMDYLSISIFTMLVYSVVYFLLCKFGKRD